MEKEFFEEFNQEALNLIEKMCVKYGVSDAEVMFQMFFGVIEDDGAVNAAILYKAQNEDEIEYMLEEVQETYEQGTNSIWNGFGLN